MDNNNKKNKLTKSVVVSVILHVLVIALLIVGSLYQRSLPVVAGRGRN